MKAVREVLRPAFAASVTIASLSLRGRTGEGCGLACFGLRARGSQLPPLIFAVLAGLAAAFAILAFIFRERARSFAHQCCATSTRLDTLATVEDNYRALASLEPQVCVIWSDNHARLALHTLHSAAGVPAKLPLLLRFASWLHPDDAGRVAVSLNRLQTRGEGFVSNASTLEGHVVEVAGAVCGAETVLRIRPFSPVNKELVRLIGENKRLKQAVYEREKLLDSLPVPVWLRDAKSALNWVNTAYATAAGAENQRGSACQADRAFRDAAKVGAAPPEPGQEARPRQASDRHQRGRANLRSHSRSS